MLEVKIQERYQKETETANLGCANLAPFFEIHPGDVILDLGCGRGRQAIQLAKKVGKNGKVVGLDLTEAMIEKARAVNPYQNVSFVQGDIEDIPFHDQTFNLVYSNCVINHSIRKKQVFSEIFRVLKKGGMFLIGDVMAVERLPESVSNDPNAIADCWGGAIPKEEYLEIVRSVGFSRLEQLSSRKYPKNGFPMESIILKGVVA